MSPATRGRSSSVPHPERLAAAAEELPQRHRHYGAASAVDARILINVGSACRQDARRGFDDQLVRRGLFAINTTPTDQKPLIDAYEKAATGKDPDQRMVDDVKEFAKD